MRLSGWGLRGMERTVGGTELKMVLGRPHAAGDEDAADEGTCGQAVVVVKVLLRASAGPSRPRLGFRGTAALPL